jgi:arylformamidase
MNKYIDISLAISEDSICWPGSPKPRFERRLEIEHGDIATDSNVFFNVHTGTHVDAPSHFVLKGKTVDLLSLDTLIGPAQVVHIPPDVTVVTASELAKMNLADNIYRLLLRTSNSDYWVNDYNSFQKDFVALSPDAAEWIVEKGIRLIGIDYLSIQRYEDGPETHQILLEAGVVIVEGLNLHSIKSGIFELICLPIKLKGLEGAPARVILRDCD